jgi:signal transduction histidine kinase
MRFRILLSAVVLLLAMTGEALSESKRVLLLHSFDRDFGPWSEIARSIRDQLRQQSRVPIDFFEASLATARTAGEEEAPFVDYLRSVFVRRGLHLVITNGASAADFIRQHLFVTVPALFTGLEQRRVPLGTLAVNDAVVAAKNDHAGAMENILRVLPETTNVVVMLGAGIAAVLLQAAIICWLLVERRRRYFAQAEAISRRREVVRLNRVTTANVLSSSIAHELNQPLGAILSNTEAAQMLLKANPPDLTQIGEILSDIVRDDQRASEIILGLRNLLNDRKEADLRAVDLNDSVREVVKIVSPEVERRGVVLRTILAPETLRVRSDPIHLQQVIINLAMNGMDAMDDAPGPHNLTIRTRRDAESDVAEVRVSDSGKGIPGDSLTRIFEAFVTTKPQGTGLGLPIARTILESYGGDIRAENHQRGAMFSFRLPLAKTRQR